LLASCVLSRETWFKLLRRCGSQHLCPDREANFVQWWLQARKTVTKSRHKAFDSLIILGAWCIWRHRNDRVFSGVRSTAAAAAAMVWEEMELWCSARLVDRSLLLTM
jgi:hypothetical protein